VFHQEYSEHKTISPIHISLISKLLGTLFFPVLFGKSDKDWDSNQEVPMSGDSVYFQ